MAKPSILDKCYSDGGFFAQYRIAKDDVVTLPVLETPPGTSMKFKGKDQIMWSVNNYLGLAEDEEIKQLAIETAKEWGVSGPMGSRMMSGTTPEHLKLEKQLAAFAQKESAILFNFGYLGVLGTVQSLVGPDDTIVMDKLSHACIIDSALGANGKMRLFRHNDMNSLESVLKKANEDRKGGILMLSEGVYGMTGDLAKLQEMSALKEKYEATMFIDDAHGIGMMGEKGRGTADYLGVQDKIEVYFGTFAKSFASIGGFTAADTAVVDWIRYNARTQIFAKSLPMIYVKTLELTLQKLIKGDDLRAKTFANKELLQKGLRDIGYYVADVPSAIVPVFIPEGEERAAQMMRYLREKGVFVSAVVYPVIPRGLALMRMIPTTRHTPEQIHETVEAFKQMRDDMKLRQDMPENMIQKIYGVDTED